MSYPIDGTHDPTLYSWVESANQPNHDFPIQNLPFGVFSRQGWAESTRIGVAIGDQILDLKACGQLGLLQDLSQPLQEACVVPHLNSLMALGHSATSALRTCISQLLRSKQPTLASDRKLLVPMLEAELHLPANIGDYTDFYASIFHAINVGKLFRPDKPLLPNYKYVPIAYHGRASSIVPSGTLIKRPWGQSKQPQATKPKFESARWLDYEMEVGCFVGVGNQLGYPIGIDNAEDHIFGYCLVNDWSARDIQAWEYQPLGPFLAKSFATTLSPWVVTQEALAPFRCPALSRPAGDPDPLPYLSTSQNKNLGGLDLTVEVWIRSAQMHDQKMDPVRLSQASFKQMYWTWAQMLAHHTSNGCNLRPGDLLASGTVSGAREGSQGSLLEMTRRGTRPIELPTGEMRSFLAEGDEIILRGYSEKTGFAKIGFGECRGIIL